MDLMQKARGKMMLKQPFFATLMITTPFVERDDIPTAGTDMEKVYWNRSFVESLGTVEKVMFLIAHEVMHICLNHGSRMRSRNPLIWNIACDYAINLILVDSGMEFIEGGMLDKQYEGMSADEIYDKLIEKADKIRQQGGSGQPGEDGMPGFDSMHGPNGDLMEPDGLNDPAKAAELARNIQQKVAQAATTARMAGKMSAGLEKFVNEILEPKVAWPDLLRDYMTRITRDDETWAKRNRRFQDVYLPDRHNERMGPIVIIGDSSGSIWCSPKELEQFASEIQAVADQVRPENIRVVWADTRVASEDVFEDGDTLKFNPQGGGGTDMRVPLEYVEKYEPHVVILLTDGYTPWPSAEPPYPLIVCCNTDTDVPVGQVIRI